ncbi:MULTISPECIES: complement resistance protein TraT [unclassified Iodidimonas]|jgi:hypothetical protein|uniref:complement resistance protein TraT n=1 Tax=unclassified Iodidimonas TaxID=2626145 RepID=UPI0024828B07|nr:MULTISPECIES: complement resistance protein TraT [unclassified Iodidimonas]
MFRKTFSAILLVTLLGVTAACTDVSRGLGKLTANKFADPRSGTNWVIAPPQLDPPRVADKTVYISFRNLSDADVNLLNELRSGASALGWVLVNDPESAKYRLRGDLRFFGEVAPESGGLGAASGLGIISGAATAVGVYALSDTIMGNNASAAIGGVGGGLVGLGIANASRPREWAMILDFVLEEYKDQPVEFTLATDANSARVDATGAGSGRMTSGGGETKTNSSTATSTRTSNYFPHGVRLTAWANQMNMGEAEAIPQILPRVERVVAQILPQ